MAVSGSLHEHCDCASTDRHNWARVQTTRFPLAWDLDQPKRRQRRRRGSSSANPEALAAYRLAAATSDPRERSNTVAGSRDNALRFLRSVIATHSTAPKAEPLPTRPSSSVSRSNTAEQGDGEDMHPGEFLRPSSRTPTNAAGTSMPPPPRQPTLQERARSDSASTVSGRSIRTGSFNVPEEKPVAAGNGVSVSIHLAEPVLFLQGFDQRDTNTRSTVMLRGNLHLKISKSVKLRAVTLKFKGTATTKWPEGIPPRKVELEETDQLMNHTWPFFNAQFPAAEKGTGADHVHLSGPRAETGHGSPQLMSSPANSNVNLPMTNLHGKRLSLQTVQQRSLDTNDARAGPTVAQRGYRTFQPGDYIYNFELPLDSRLPETVDVDLGSVKYELEATIERAGAFRGNVIGSKEITVIRAPAEGSLEQVEPIAISRTWEDQLHYDIVISGKSFPLGSKIPIAFKLTPLAKVQCHRIKVYITENTEYFCSNKKVHRMEPVRKLLLFEKRSDGPGVSTFPGSTMRITAGGGIPWDQREAAARGEHVVPQDTLNLLGRLDTETTVGPTEMEVNVQLPGCTQTTEKDKALSRLHFDTTYQNIQVHHWIKIVLRLSKPDENDSGKRRHFEISIDSPFHILSCRATQANMALPAYSSPDNSPQSASLADCGCPGAPRRQISPQYAPTLNALDESQPSNDQSSRSSTSANSSPSSPVRAAPNLTRPPLAHISGAPMAVQRPMHMVRAPSFNPPAFDDEDPPPALVTPPPQYNDIASPTAGHGLRDYFSRLAEAGYDDDDDEDEDDDESEDGDGGGGGLRHRRASSRSGRVNVPLTPGSRVSRSMDLQRSWVPVGD